MVAVAIVALLPVLVGPATMPLVRALGGLETHHCACGMEAGKCGCPECGRLEQQRRADDEELRGQATWKVGCGDAQGLSGTSGALATLPTQVDIAVRSHARIDAAAAPADRPSRGRSRPPIPPPRRAGA